MEGSWENGSKYQEKEKDEESNGVYKEDEKSVRGSRSSIEESIGITEGTSR